MILITVSQRMKNNKKTLASHSIFISHSLHWTKYSHNAIHRQKSARPRHRCCRDRTDLIVKPPGVARNQPGPVSRWKDSAHDTWPGGEGAHTANDLVHYRCLPAPWPWS